MTEARVHGRSTSTQWLLTASLWILFTSLVIDGFPPGAAMFREFGARPTNFLLLIAIVALAVRTKLQRGSFSISLSNSWILLFVLVALPLTNLPVALWQAGTSTSVIVDWVKQYLMLAWGITSYFVWKSIIRGCTWERYASLMTWGCVLPVVCFFLGYIDTSGTASAVLDAFRGLNPRPSSLATEPSIYGAWAAFVWPVVLYMARKARTPLGRFGAGTLLPLMAASAYLSKARTFAVILLLQFLYAAYWTLTKRQSWGKRIRYLLAALFITVTGVLALAARFLTLIHFDSEGSNIARLAYTIAGINVSFAHPLFGIGIGQFGNYFAQYVPQFALGIKEIDQHLFGVAQYRASTFNLFVRLCTEFGIPLGLFLSAVILRPLVRATKLVTSEPFLFYAALSAAGGVAFWLSQDQYGYQPAIVALAALGVLNESAGRRSRLPADLILPGDRDGAAGAYGRSTDVAAAGEATSGGVESPSSDHVR